MPYDVWDIVDVAPATVNHNRSIRHVNGPESNRNPYRIIPLLVDAVIYSENYSACVVHNDGHACVSSRTQCKKKEVNFAGATVESLKFCFFDAITF